MVGTISLVYSHDTRELADKLTDIQHQFHSQIITSLHVHLDAHNCLEVLILRGTGHQIKTIAKRLIVTRGVKHGKLMTTTTGLGLF